ncbi:MAG TPA: MFS transporter, partial [Steroidobacteraceae bacterium]|nr:MFS transporter [Steroidobacteraceae bacterium]
MDAVLDAGRLRGQSLLVCVCTFSVMILDGFDIQIIGFAAPALVAEFGIERSALGLALAASVVGMSLGAMAIGRIGDRFGRRPALLLSTVLFGATTLLGATATDVTSLAAWRFLTGLGLGAALPSAVALMAEFAPARHRSQLIVASLLGVPVGGILGSALAAELVPMFGWRAIFIAGGLLPLAAAAALVPLLPESPRFLAARGERRPDGDDHSAFQAVFAPGLARDTWIMALAFFTNMIAVYAFFSWVPLVLTSVGFALDDAVRSGLVFNLAGVVGSLLNAWLIARIGSRLPLVAVASVAIFALIGLTCVAALGDAASQSPRNITLYFAAIAIAGFGIHALQSGLYIVSAHVFPTQCRTSGVGFA